MNILLVSPRTPSTFWSFRHTLRFAGVKAAFPPLGLLTVAAMLPDDWSLRLVDLNVASLTDVDIAWADAVFVSAMIVHEDSARDVIARSHAHGKPVVGGGPLFTTGAERFSDVECCVVGEAEDIMPQLVADLVAGRLEARYQAAERPDVTTTPVPRWDLIRVRDYMTMSVQTSRGCPFDCEFCDITAVYGRVPRVKTPEQVTVELDALMATGWDGAVFIVDDNFIGHRAKARSLLRALVDWNGRRRHRVGFITEASLNLVDDPELLGLMAQAGFKKVFVGIESPNEESLLECHKVQNSQRDLLSSVRTIQNAGIQVMGGFIVGFDSDDHDTFERQRWFIQEAGIVSAMVGMLTALPGTRLFTRLTREGRLVNHSSGDNLDAQINFEPVLDRETLVNGYRRLVQELYEPRQYYRRIANFLREYRPPRSRARLRRPDVHAFFRSLWTLGLASPGRLQYWTFLARTLTRHRRAFAEAVELAIMGYHFRTVAGAL